MSEAKKKAVILFNLGGPDRLDAVGPFLFNLFNDKRIISLPNPFRWLLAKFISHRRKNFAKEIYTHIGGKSPILEETKAQANALSKSLGPDFEIFIAMRYWHPFIEEVLPQIRQEEFDEVIFLPLYPQFSTTTSLSSIESCIDKISIHKKIICCYYGNPLFIKAHAELILQKYEEAEKIGKPVVLFSAHGLPVKIVQKGDPYQFQVEQSVKKIVKELLIKDLDYKICYQSKVGRMKWLEPDTEEVIKENSKKPIVLCPVAFVSEHSETLVELDIEYGALAEHFFRVPTLSCHPKFIECLAELCKQELKPKSCPAKYKMCFCNMQKAKCTDAKTYANFVA